MNNYLSIYVVTYNRASYLKKSVESILKQTFKNYDLFIVDNCSTDNTEEIVKKFSDPRIHYIKHKKNIGEIENINFAFKHCQSKYLVIFHDDDIMQPRFIEKELKMLECGKGFDIVSCKVEFIDKYGNILKRQNEKYSKPTQVYTGGNLFSAYIEKRKFIYFPTNMYRTEFIKTNELFLKSEAGPSADILLCFEVERYGGRIAVLNEKLIQYRVHGEQTSNLYRTEMVVKLFEYLKSNEYYRKLLSRHKHGQQRYYCKILYNECCLLANEKITLEEAKISKAEYQKCIYTTSIERLFFSFVFFIMGSFPKTIKRIYRIGKSIKNRIR